MQHLHAFLVNQWAKGVLTEASSGVGGVYEAHNTVHLYDRQLTLTRFTPLTS